MPVANDSQKLKKTFPKKSAKQVKSLQPKKAKISDIQAPALHLGIMVANVDATSVAGTIGVTFKEGGGQITATLFRNGVLINLQTISSDGNIFFSDIQPKDGIAVNGVCTGVGGADITISVTTNPTPQHFDTGFIHGLFIVN